MLTIYDNSGIDLEFDKPFRVNTDTLANRLLFEVIAHNLKKPVASLGFTKSTLIPSKLFQGYFLASTWREHNGTVDSNIFIRQSDIDFEERDIYRMWINTIGLPNNTKPQRNTMAKKEAEVVATETKTTEVVDNFITKHDKEPQYSNFDAVRLYKRIFTEPFGITYQQFTGAVLRFLIEKCQTSITLERSMCFDSSKFFGFFPGGKSTSVDGYPVVFAVKPMVDYRADSGFGVIGDINQVEFGDVSAIQLYLGCVSRSFYKGIYFEMVEDVKAA